MTVIGEVGGDALVLEDLLNLPVSESRALIARGLTSCSASLGLLLMAPFDDFRDGPRDECGVFGIYAPDHDVARLSYFALYALQHRGQESAGIASAPRGGPVLALRDQGLVSQVFDEHMLRSLVGDLAIGHVRYSTTGSSQWENTQPIVRDDNRSLALAHNGNLINAVELHSELRGRDVPFRSTSDSEIIAALLATHPGRADRGRRRRGRAAVAGRVLDGRDDRRMRGRLP